jgi:hypothetical protein
MARFARFLAFVAFLCFTAPAPPALAGGPYTEGGYPPGWMLGWATAVADFERGFKNIAQPGLGLVTQGVPETALGPASGTDVFDVVSLGDGGWIELFFAGGIADGPGDDLAVFENGFYGPEGLFAELAFVEVSSNGVDYARFDPITLHSDPVPSFGAMDPSDLRYLAGDQPMGQGTGFDLAELSDHPLVADERLDLQQVFFVRIVDAVGDGSRQDSLGSPVYDPYPTPFAEGGFDLQGVGALHAVPEPDAAASLGAGAAALALLGRRRRRARGAASRR